MPNVDTARSRSPSTPSSSVVEAAGASDSLSYNVRCISSALCHRYNYDTEVLVNTALIARIEMLEAENKQLCMKLGVEKQSTFSIECIAKNDKL